MGLFQGVKSLFQGAAGLFAGQSKPTLPTQEQLFSGDAGPFGSSVMVAPGQPAPGFTIGVNRPLEGPGGREINAPKKEGPLHVYTFSSLWNSASKTYSWRWDEAYRRCREDALAMRRDCFLMSLLFERKYPTAQMPWHLEPDDKKNAGQMKVADYVKSCVDTLPNVPEMSMTMLEALWYGRAGGQMTWTNKTVHGMPSFVPETVTPVNGDKIQFTWDGIPQVRIYGGVDKADAKQDDNHLTRISNEFSIPREDIVSTDRGVMLKLFRPYWRDRFIIHKHDLIDADFYEGDMAGGVHGVGIRHWIYWFDWIKKEIASYILDFLERTGAGFSIYYYDPGNPQDKANVEQIAKQQGRNTWIVWPRAPGSEGAQKGVERIEPNTAGATVLKDLLAYYDGYIERFVIGQSMSSGADNESGLGGSGRANFARSTKNFIIRHDCMKLAGSYSTDLVKPLVRFNRQNCERIYGKPLDFEVRWKYDIDADDPKAKLESGKILFDMGVTLKEDELRSVGGFEKPAADDKVIGGQQQPQGGAPGGQQPGQYGLPGATNGQAGAKPLFQGAQLAGAANGLEAGTPEKEKEREASVRYEWEQEAERYGVDSRKLTALAEAIRDDLLRYEGGAWVTVGGHEEGDKKHVDGQPVKVEWLEKWKSDAADKKGLAVKKKPIAPEPEKKDAAPEPEKRVFGKKTKMHPVRGVRQDIEDVLREEFGDKAKAIADDVGLALHWSRFRQAVVKHSGETSATSEEAEKLKGKIAGILDKIGDKMKERGITLPPEDAMKPPKPFSWANRDKSEEEKENKLKREAVAARKKYAEEHWKNPPEIHTVPAEQWGAIAMYQKYMEAKKDEKKLLELKALQDDLRAAGDAYYENRHAATDAATVMRDRLNAADDAWDKAKNKPANKKLLKKYRPGWYDKKDIPDARDAYGKLESIIKRFDEDWRMEDYIPATDEHTQALQDHRSAVKKALDEEKDVPHEIWKDFEYEDWLPKKYQEERTSRNHVQMHGIYMKGMHDYYNSLAEQAMKHAEPEVDEILKAAGPAPNFEKEWADRGVAIGNAHHAAFQAFARFRNDQEFKNDETGEMELDLSTDELKAKHDALEKAVKDAEAELFNWDTKEREGAKTEREAAEKWLEKLLPEGGNDAIKIHSADFLTDESKGELKKAESFLRKVFAKSWGKMESKLVELPAGKIRAHQSGDEHHCPPDESAWTFVHEFGHRVENMNGHTLGVLSRAFAMQAVKESGQEVKRLESWFDAHEVGAKNGFRDRYIGKFYDHESSEVLSMGIQYLYQEPAKFFREDPKHFKWTLAAIHGLLT